MSFQSSGVIETGLSDFHKMTVTVMKTTFEKSDPKIIHYRDYQRSIAKFQARSLAHIGNVKNIFKSRSSKIY